MCQKFHDIFLWLLILAKITRSWTLTTLLATTLQCILYVCVCVCNRVCYTAQCGAICPSDHLCVKNTAQLAQRGIIPAKPANCVRHCTVYTLL